MKILWALVLVGVVVAPSAEGGLPLAQPMKSWEPAKTALFDTIYVIPAGPVAGGFTQDSRIQVIDTIAGWARVQIEGWTPVSSVRWTSASSLSGSVAMNEAGLSKQTTQCTAITKKGTRCKRAAKPGTSRCWQHPQ